MYLSISTGKITIVLNGGELVPSPWDLSDGREVSNVMGVLSMPHEHPDYFWVDRGYIPQSLLPTLESQQCRYADQTGELFLPIRWDGVDRDATIELFRQEFAQALAQDPTLLGRYEDMRTPIVLTDNTIADVWLFCGSITEEISTYNWILKVGGEVIPASDIDVVATEALHGLLGEDK